jgi:hypothetical protein
MAMTTPTDPARPNQPATVGSAKRPGQEEATDVFDRASSADRADTRVLAAVHKAFRLATGRLADATDELSPEVSSPSSGHAGASTPRSSTITITSRTTCCSRPSWRSGQIRARSWRS